MAQKYVGVLCYFDRGFGHADASAACVERIWELSVRIPQECIGRCTCEWQIPHSALHKVPHTHMLELQTHGSYCAGFQVQWPSAKLRNRHRRVWTMGWRQLIPETYGTYDEATFHMSGTVRHHNFRIWGCKMFHVLLARPDPVCLRAPPVTMNFLSHSRIDGVLEGNGKLSEFFAIFIKTELLCVVLSTRWIYSSIWRFLY